jgi:hypothetical protein
MITYYLKEGKAKKDASDDAKDDTKANVADKDSSDNKEIALKALTGVQKKDSIQFDIFSGSTLIRTLKYKTPEKAGFHRIYWNMDEKGADRPSRKIDKKTNESGGVAVKPGIFKIKMSYGTTTDEAQIEVKSDPRLTVDVASLNQVYETGKKLQNFSQTAADAVKQLVESKEVAEKYQKELKELDKEKYKDAIKSSTDIVKKIDDFIAIYIGKEDKRQGITRNAETTVMQRINEAINYAESRKTGITTTENQLVQFAENELKAALDKTNTFFNTDWKTYREDIEKLNNSPFKETKIISIK